MTRRLRMILLIILAVMLCVVFSMPSLAFEAEEPVQEAEPEEMAVTEPAPEPTVTISAPVEIAVIPDEDWGSVGPEALANLFTPAVTEEAENNGDTEPEETPAPAESPAAEAAAAPETPGPAENGPEPVADETPAADQPAEETPVTDLPAADIPEGDTAVEEPDESEPDDLPPAEEPVQETEPEEETEDPETAPEPEKARVTVTVEISMIDETVMRLLAVVNDPEGRDFLYQWQVSEDSGMTYMDIPEANTDELKVELTDDNINDMWRVRVEAV